MTPPERIRWLIYTDLSLKILLPAGVVEACFRKIHQLEKLATEKSLASEVQLKHISNNA